MLKPSVLIYQKIYNTLKKNCVAYKNKGKKHKKQTSVQLV